MVLLCGMKKMDKQKIRIQASGHFFDVDITLSEKKALTYLKRLKRIQQTGIKAIKDHWREENSYRKWGGYRRGYYIARPRLSDFVAEEHGIKKTTYTLTVI